MKSYTSVNFSCLITFLLKNKISILISSLIISIFISISLFFSYNSLDIYYPKGKTRDNILNKINKIESEILYLEKINENNFKYINDSIYFSFSETGAFQKVIQINLEEKNKKMILSKLNNNFYDRIIDISKLELNKKYLKEIIYYYLVENGLQIVILYNDYIDYYLYYSALLNYFNTEFGEDKSHLNVYSTKFNPASNFKDVWFSYMTSISDTDLLIQERKSELNTYKDLFNKSFERASFKDFIKIFVFIYLYIFLLLVFIMIILYVLIKPCMSKSEYEKYLEINFVSLDEHKKYIYLTNFLLIRIRFAKFDLKSNCFVLTPGIIFKKMLVNFINMHLDDTFSYSEDKI